MILQVLDNAASVADSILADSPGFDRWMARHGTDEPISSNQPSLDLPFQRWFKFKEAFAPQFILECFDILGRQPRRCLDPFGGSGTTALTCQFAGVEPVTIEVNPFLADLIEAKVARVEPAALQRAFLDVCRQAVRLRPNLKESYVGAPATLIEPGIKGRWIYNRDVAYAIAQLRFAIERQSRTSVRRVLRVALGAVLVELSNAVVNGKGRRYRGNWQQRKVTSEDVMDRFTVSFSAIFADLCMFTERKCHDYQLLRGDSRQLVRRGGKFDAAIFSPPYPNSFDYTDIYNLELWMLGYLDSKQGNQVLRRSTLRSHVQVDRPFESNAPESRRLQKLYAELCANRDDLWDHRIPEMVISYFADMRQILEGLRDGLEVDGRIFMAVGNSQYAGIQVDVPRILTEISRHLGLDTVHSCTIRSMRTSAQQGGDEALAESLVVLKRR